MIQMMDLRLVYMYKFLNLCSSLRICVLNLLEYQVGKVMSAHSESFVWRTDGPGLIDSLIIRVLYKYRHLGFDSRPETSYNKQDRRFVF
jgi:hypothetical protein